MNDMNITLATRDKATAAPAVNYPIFVKRPGSASVTLTTPSARLAANCKFLSATAKANSLHFLQAQTTKQRQRPVSADFKYHHSASNSTKSSPNISYASANEQLCSIQKNKRALTSSNIYKLLLAEPIKRSWMTSDTSTSNESTATATATAKDGATEMKASQKMSANGSDDDSCEEKIQEVLSQSSEDDGTNNDRDEIPNRIDVSKQSWCHSTSIDLPELTQSQTMKTAVIKAKTSTTNTNSRFTLNTSFTKQTPPSSLRIGAPNKEKEPSLATTSTDKYVSFNNNNKDLKISKSNANANTGTASIETNSFNLLKTDLPGRVSFSKNDVYEIDYSDFENDTDTSRSLDQNEPLRKKNVHFEDEYFDRYVDNGDNEEMTCDANAIEDSAIADESSVKNQRLTDERRAANGFASDNGTSETNRFLADDKYCCSLKCNSLMCKTESPTRLEMLPEANEFSESTRSAVDNSEKIIEEYKREIQNINRQHELELKWSGNKLNSPTVPLADYVGDCESAQPILDSEEKVNNEYGKNSGSGSWSSPNAHNENNLINKSKLATVSNASDESPTRDSTSTVINNYLKVTNQKAANATKPNSATINLKTTKKTTITQPTNGNQRKIKSAQIGNIAKVNSGNRMTKAKSIGNLQSTNADIKLNEFQIDKVESWMSTHVDTFSDAGLNSYRKQGKFGSGSNLEYKKAWRETPTSKTDDEGNFSLDDQIDSTSIDGSTYGEIELVLRKLEGRRMKISFDAIKNSVAVPTISIGSSSTSQQTQNMSVSNGGSTSNDKSSDKIKAILQYLDEVDYNCDRTISNIQLEKIPESYRSQVEFNIDADIVGDIPQVEELLLLTNEQLARRVIGLSLRANELSNAIQLSKEHVGKIRNDNQKAIRVEKQTAQARLKEQKNHYEGIVTRHQGFIEQLLKDKASLCEKVSAITKRIESQQQTSEHKLQTEITRVKEIALAGEKIRRERWVRENTKKIKELTVKGLEQEISKMAFNHQKEITELKRQHQQEILAAVEEARQKHESLEMNIRENYVQDREAAIEKERSTIRERFERQMEIEQKSFEDYKTRLMAEFAAEKERLQNEQRQKEHDFEVRREKLIQDKKELVEHLNREFSDKVRMIEKRNQSEIASIREQFESDFAIWKREQETMYKLREVENANAIRQQCRLERDKQIDSIVAKVDAETLKIQQDYDVKISRMKSQYESELRDMERGERQTREKYNETRSKLAECEANIQNFHATIKQLEIQLSHSQRMCDNFVAEKQHFKENARKEIQQEIETLRKERDNEIQQIHKRVQNAIGKKDASMDVLQKENESLKDRCLKLEAIIRQQRKDYCTK